MGSSDRKPYLTATVLDQALLDAMADNLDFGLEMVCEISSPAGGFIYVSDGNRYVGSTFYTARTAFPVIKRSIGEWLAPDIEFSRLTVQINNVDGAFENVMPGGADYNGWIGQTVQVRVGLRDVGATYKNVYKGRVTEVGGFQRARGRFTLVSRDELDRINRSFPTLALSAAAFPDLADDMVGFIVPVIYGDWTVHLVEGGASIPAYPVNSKSATVIAGTTNVQLIVSTSVNSFFDSTKVYLKRQETFYPFDVADVVNVNANKNQFQIRQSGSGGTTLIEGAAYTFASGDNFFVTVKGIDLGAHDDNAVAQARDILTTYGLATPGDFDANWDTYRDKAAPAQSAISLIKSRAWVQEPENAVTYALSLLEQVRLEMFIDRDLMLRLSSLHFEDFVAAPSYTIRQWDVKIDDGVVPQLDERNTWNRVRGDYNFDPAINGESRSTSVYRNAASITQVGKAISKKLVFPNLYIATDVANQTKEMLKLASSSAEQIDLVVTPRASLLDIGDTVALNFSTMGGLVFENVPALIREIGVDPSGKKIPMRVWSWQMVPFPGWAPGYSGITGGSTATITEE